jgi:hypothetical protein
MVERRSPKPRLSWFDSSLLRQLALVATTVEQSPCKREVVGSNPTGGTIFCLSVGQLVDRLIWDQEIVGSSPTT